MINKNSFSLAIVKKPDKECFGMTSRCDDLKHILLIDYDNIERDLVEREYSQLQKEFHLPPAYFFATKELTSGVSGRKYGNYQIRCLKKLPFHKIEEILQKTHCDPFYKSMFKRSRYKAWVLRDSKKGDREKPAYLGIIGENKNLDGKISLAHLLKLKKLYDIDIVEYNNVDDNIELVNTSYLTY